MTKRKQPKSKRARNVRVAIVGVGNCASALVQGVHYYQNKRNDGTVGLMHENLDGLRPQDIKFVAAFDIDKRKVTKDISKAIFAKPNCAQIFQKTIPFLKCRVERGFLLDGVARHMLSHPDDRTFVIDEFLDDFCSAEDEAIAEKRISDSLKKKKVDVLINLLPVGSEDATRFYARCALNAGCAMVNGIPVFIASDKKWADKFRKAGLPIIGDDIKSQFGATILHRMITRLLVERGAAVDRTYQLNTGGNTDFLNMLNRDRLASKKISKTEAVQSQLPTKLDKNDIHIGPSDYVPWQNDNKICFIRVEGRVFGDIPFDLEVRLSVQDSPNSAGVLIDAVRLAKVALERNHKGPIFEASAYLMKHPPKQMTDDDAYDAVEKFISGK
ncbi:MAG: inositol-3-phosphate synthase [Candidatus Lindowbacteria bacterium]|nr:inositol-3-phosphate synthase [Candidatus Lindowbacteria bacterium]